jgi:outer membrane protein assembly factor BamB
LTRTIQTVPGVADVRGIAGSAVTGKLYVAYYDASGTGMIYCLDVNTDAVVWNKAIPDGVDRLASAPDGRLIYVPTWEGGTANYIQVLDAGTGDLVRRVYFSNRSHDTQYPLSGTDLPGDEGCGWQRELPVSDRSPHVCVVARGTLFGHPRTLCSR